MSITLETLTLVADSDNPSVLWPRVFVLIREQSGEQELEMPAIKQTEHEAVYNYPEGSQAIIAFRSLKQRFVFENCDVVSLQNARSGVRVARNKNLVSSADTHSDFVYQTPLVQFNDRMTPLLAYDKTLPINFRAGLRESISTLFQSLFTVADRTWAEDSDRCISVTCRYGFELVASVAGEEPIISQVPILFCFSPGMHSSSIRKIRIGVPVRAALSIVFAGRLKPGRVTTQPAEKAGSMFLTCNCTPVWMRL